MNTLRAPIQIDTTARNGHDRIRQEWTAIAGKIIRRWPKVTVDDVLVHAGNAEYLAGILQERYEVDRREALSRVHAFEDELRRRVA